MTAELLAKPVPEQPPEYITAQTFDAFQQEMRTALANLRQQLTSHESRLTAAQDKQTGDIAVITAMMQAEQHERKADISAIRSDFQSMLEQLRTVSTGISGLTVSIAGLEGSMRNWQSVMETQTREHERLSDHIDAAEADIALLMTSHSSQKNAIQLLSDTLHGNPAKPDAQPSMFKMLETLSSQVASSTQEHSKLILSLMSQNQGMSVRLETIETHQKDQAAKWSKRRAQLASVAVGIAKTPAGATGISAVLLGVGASLLPQAIETVTLFIELIAKALEP